MNHISISVRTASQWRTEHDSPQPRQCYLPHFQIFNKIDIFQKTFWISLEWKKANCFFEELSNLYLIVLLISFFRLLLLITTDNKTKLKKLFIWTTKSGRTQLYKHTNCSWLFINNCNNASDILDSTWYLRCTLFFNSVSVLLNFFVNWALSVA